MKIHHASNNKFSVCAAAILFSCILTYANDSLVVMLPNSVPLVLIKIPSGSFTMGSQDPVGSPWNTCDWTPSCDKPAHKVTFAYSFYMGKYEITQQQWQAVMDTNPSTSKKFPTCPVEHVSWNDCQTFCAKITAFLNIGTFRLPSESEWEYACRAGTTTRYFFSDTGCAPTVNAPCLLNDYAWWSNNNPGYVQPVGLKKPNPWGFYDILGNVYEWCQDNFHFSYTGAPVDGSPWLTDSIGWKSIRGAWRDYPEPRKYTSFFRARHENYYDFRHDCCGMRIAFRLGNGIIFDRLRSKLNYGNKDFNFFQSGKSTFVFSAASNSPIRIYNLKGSCIATIPMTAAQEGFRGTWDAGNVVHGRLGAACYIADQDGNSISHRIVSISK
jgi:formylglycine-generating enzyme required for sulfatase activity